MGSMDLVESTDRCQATEPLVLCHVEPLDAKSFPCFPTSGFTRESDATLNQMDDFEWHSLKG